MKKTWGETCAEFVACKTSGEARIWLAKEVTRHSAIYGKTLEESAKIILSSLGYMMGYYDDATAERMQKLLDLSHPALPWVGKMPTTEANLKKAFIVGKNMAKK